MNDQTPTLNSFFSVEKDTPKHQFTEHWQKLQERLKKEVKVIKWTGSRTDIALKIAELLDVRISKIFTNCWKKSEELSKVLEDSKKEPDVKFEIDLAEHTVSSEHNPYIEIKFNNTFKYEINFVLKMIFKIKSFILIVQNGEIKKIITGICEAEGSLWWEGLKLLEKKLEPVVLPKLI